MQDISEICCGPDVHKETVVACIIKTAPSVAINYDPNPGTTKEIRVFKTLLNDLNSLKNWPESENCHHAAMESTGIYRCPVYDVSEVAFDGDIELSVTDARHMKNVPGKKKPI